MLAGYYRRIAKGLIDAAREIADGKKNNLTEIGIKYPDTWV